jgi:hypothetical protein
MVTALTQPLDDIGGGLMVYDGVGITVVMLYRYYIIMLVNVVERFRDFEIVLTSAIFFKWWLIFCVTFCQSL